MRRQGTAVVGCMLGLIMGMACAEVREETSGRDPVTLQEAELLAMRLDTPPLKTSESPGDPVPPGVQVNTQGDEQARSLTPNADLEPAQALDPVLPPAQAQAESAPSRESETTAKAKSTVRPAPTTASGIKATESSKMGPSKEKLPPQAPMEARAAPEIEEPAEARVANPTGEAPIQVAETPDCSGWSERRTSDAGLRELVHRQVKALAGSANTLPWPKVADIARQLRIARASGAPNLPPGDPDAVAALLLAEQEGSMKAAFQRAQQADKELGFSWSDVSIQSTELYEACKYGNVRGAGRVSFSAGGSEYTLWIEDLLRTSAGFRAGYVKRPTEK